MFRAGAVFRGSRYQTDKIFKIIRIDESDNGEIIIEWNDHPYTYKGWDSVVTCELEYIGNELDDLPQNECSLCDLGICKFMGKRSNNFVH